MLVFSLQTVKAKKQIIVSQPFYMTCIYWYSERAFGLLTTKTLQNSCFEHNYMFFWNDNCSWHLSTLVRFLLKRSSHLVFVFLSHNMENNKLSLTKHRESVLPIMSPLKGYLTSSQTRLDSYRVMAMWMFKSALLRYDGIHCLKSVQIWSQQWWWHRSIASLIRWGHSVDKS